MTVGDLCDRLGFRELADWVAYERGGGGGTRALAEMSNDEIQEMLGGG